MGFLPCRLFGITDSYFASNSKYNVYNMYKYNLAFVFDFDNTKHMVPTTAACMGIK